MLGLPNLFLKYSCEINNTKSCDFKKVTNKAMVANRLRTDLGSYTFFPLLVRSINSLRRILPSKIIALEVFIVFPYLLFISKPLMNKAQGRFLC